MMRMGRDLALNAKSCEGAGSVGTAVEATSAVEKAVCDALTADERTQMRVLVDRVAPR